MGVVTQIKDLDNTSAPLRFKYLKPPPLAGNSPDRGNGRSPKGNSLFKGNVAYRQKDCRRAKVAVFARKRWHGVYALTEGAELSCLPTFPNEFWT